MRLRQLDVLRAFAVLLVMVRHLKEGKDNPGLVALVAHVHRAPADVRHLPELVLWALYRVGWTGVDLFFVLSGFLVSGLLFREHQEQHSIRIGRFLIRRGFKIYPLFYAFLFSTVIAITLFTARKLSLAAIVCETFFVQNYGPNIWGHTWSLAIEEHFYVCLALLLLVLSRREAMGRITQIFAFAAVAFPVARIITTLRLPEFDFKTHVFATHLRLDALLYGVALSYVWHYQRDRLAFAERSAVRPWLLVFGFASFVPPLLLPQAHPIMRTVGLSGLSIGASLFVLWSMTGPRITSRPISLAADVLAKMGFYSYAIYLWHLPVLVVGVPIAAKIVDKVLHRSLGALGETLVYLTATIFIAVVTARAVELPALRVRERLFPSAAR